MMPTTTVDVQDSQLALGALDLKAVEAPVSIS
jgi:hypothetical protein